MAPKDDYNPNSPDAMFATIIERLDGQDEVMGKILEQTTKTNGRVTAVEKTANSSAGKLRALAYALTLFLTVAGILGAVFREEIRQDLFLHDSVVGIVSTEFNVARKP